MKEKVKKKVILFIALKTAKNKLKQGSERPIH